MKLHLSCVALLAVLLFAQDSTAQSVSSTTRLGRAEALLTEAFGASAGASAAGAFVVGDNVAYHSIDIAVDAQGGLHAALMVWAFADQHDVLYGYCPPADPTACAALGGWTFVPVTQDMPFVQLELTPAGQPRLLLYNDGIYDSNYSDYTLYRYAECDAACTSSGGWQVTDLWRAETGGGLYTNDYNAQSFALDAEGHPRFVYHYGVEWSGEYEYSYTYYFAGCETECTDPENWWHRQIPSYGYTDDLGKAALALTADGRPRLITIVDYDLETWLVYMECTGACAGPEDWSVPVPVVYIGSGTGIRYWSLRLDAQDRPRVAAQPLAKPIHYFWCDAACDEPASWQGYWIRFGDTDEYPVLVLDRQDRPRLAFTHDYSLGYAWCLSDCETMNPAWRYVTADAADALAQDLNVPILPGCESGAWFSGHRPSLVLDAADNPRFGHDGEFMMRCYNDPQNPNSGDTFVEVKWWTSRIVLFPHSDDTASPVEPAPGVPVRATLEPNYPNPFNPQTTVPFTLVASSHVRLAVYDAVGREVAVLIDEVRPAGTHAVQWQASTLSSGVYFVKLQTGTQTVTRPLTLLK